MLHTFVALVKGNRGILNRLILLAGVIGIFSPMHAMSQQIRIRVLDANSGKPFKRVNLTIGTIGAQTSSFHVETDSTGLALVKVTPNGSISIYAMGYQTDCRPGIEQTKPFPVNEIVATGISIANSCGKKTYIAAPGELVLFVRKTTFLERD
jgi:hypothetical protein